MKKRSLFTVIMIALSMCLLAACGGSGSDRLPVSDTEYADYVGERFSGKDPWGGDLSITIRSVVNGKMDWTFVNAFENHTFFQEQGDTEVKDGAAEYIVQGDDAESDNASFYYEGTIELADGQVALTFLKGSVSISSPEGGSDSRMAEALEPSGIDNKVILKKAPEGSMREYEVKEGDSIHSIAKQFGLTTKELAMINQNVIIETAQAHGHKFDDVIEYAKYLFPGEILKIPVD